MNTTELEQIKLEKEIALLDNRIRSNQHKEYRNWITLLSIVVGTIISIIGLYEVFAGINYKNNQLAMESMLRSNDVFVNQILDRISAVQSHNFAINDKGEMVESSRNLYGTTAQRGATVAAVGLAIEFKHLREPARIAIESQLKAASSSPVWKDDEKYLRALLSKLNKLSE